jgi:hypothetical protein
MFRLRHRSAFLATLGPLDDASQFGSITPCGLRSVREGASRQRLVAVFAGARELARTSRQLLPQATPLATAVETAVHSRDIQGGVGCC